MTATMIRPMSVGAHGRASPAPLLVACDGTAGADGALVAARLLAEREGGQVEVVAVAEPLPVVLPEMGGVIYDPSYARAATEALLHQVRARAAELGNPAWPVTVETGDPAATIVRLAREHRARLIVMGLGRHDVTERLFGPELTLQVMRAASVPVLAVPATLRALPRRAVVAVDFSEQSIRAARMAADVVTGGEPLELAHVEPRAAAVAEWASLRALYREEATQQLAEVTTRLARCGRRSHGRLLEGDPAHALLELARTTGADLIAMGTQGRGFMHRMLLGSVATRVVRQSHSAVLVVPRSAVESRALGLWPGWTQDGTSDPEAWPAMLTEFTRANAERLVLLELEGEASGTQVEGFPLRGVAYDPRDQRVEIMLGPLVGAGPHLTHAVPGVQRVDVLRDERGRDVELRLEHEGAETRLSLLA